MKRSSFISLTLGFALAFAHTGKTEDSPATLKVGEFTFDGAKQWKVKKSPRAMSAGGFELAKKGEALAADFYHFGKGQGGTIDANVARWRGQFEGKPEPKKETLTFGKHKVHIIQIQGTYLSGRPFGPKTPMNGQAMLGAIIESSEGHVFVKMTGEAKAIAAASKAFKALCTSPLKK